MITAADILQTPVRTLPADTTLRDAAALLGAWQVSGAPVVDETGALVGIVSESDLLSEARKRAGLPRTAAFGVWLPVEDALRRIYHDGAHLLVREVMTGDVLTATPETSVDELGATMVKRRINRIPIVSGDGTLLGIVTREDVLRAIYADRA
ncbi:MAG: CBS domain-containing protein [Armatimonadota bacterium]